MTNVHIIIYNVDERDGKGLKGAIGTYVNSNCRGLYKALLRSFFRFS